MIRLRNPKVDDAIIREIIVKELVPYSANTVSADELSAKSITERLNRSTTFVFTNKKNNVVCGFINFIIKDQQVIIDMIALDARFQGLGLGGRLLRAAEKQGRKNGCVQSTLTVDDSNVKAYQFYEKHGYQITDYITHIRSYRLWKNL